MVKKIITCLFFIILTTSCQTNQNNNPKNNIETNTGETITSTGINEETPKVIELSEEEKKKQKVEALRKKLALRGLILKGDLNLQNQEYTSALVKYLQIIKEIPDDPSTIHKLGDVYFNLKKYKKAYSYYSQIKDYDKLDKDRMVKALFSFTKITEENIEYLSSELDTIGLSKEQLFYYKNSLSCIRDFSLCKKGFQDFFAARKIEEEEKAKQLENNEGTGTTEEEIPRFEDLYNIEQALINYENFQVDDLLYKGALVSGAFFENGLYPIAIETSKMLLAEKKDYKPLLKLIAKSYYELGNYVDAKLYLIEYNKLVKKDPEASYFLGVVYEKLHEYILSTIHFKKAMKTGYENSYDLNKRILFNYYELGEIEKMLETFKILVDDFTDEVNINDFSLAVYYHIVNDEIETAKEISTISLEKFPESEVLNGYMGWILMEEVNRKPEEQTGTGELIGQDEIIQDPYAEAEKYINKGLEIDDNSPMLNLVKGKLEISKGDISKGFIYFKKTVSLDNNGDFGKIAKQELEGIQINKKDTNEDEQLEEIEKK